MPQQGKPSYERMAWTDRFNTPTAARLRDGLPANARGVFDHLRQRLTELDGVRESLAWHGDCWHWTLEYHTRHSEEPLAIVVPCPGDLQLAMPVTREFSKLLTTRRLKRAVRDGLELAQEPFDNRWGVWSVTGVSLLDDLQDLIELKLAQLAKRAG